MAAVSLEIVTGAARAVQLDVFGALHEGDETVLLLGPHEPGFWACFQSSAEYLDAAPHPLDRWSKRVIGALALDLNARAVFPSDGPPYPPFQRWAIESGRCWTSPIGMLVHDVAGLMLSFRGALVLPGQLSQPATKPSPCGSCADQPCRTACPVSALTPDGYDVETCKSHVASAAGYACLETGCLARQACPVSAQYGRVAAQSEFHMKAFLNG